MRDYITIEMADTLRKRSGVGLNECLRCLRMADGNQDLAYEIAVYYGIAVAKNYPVGYVIREFWEKASRERISELEAQVEELQRQLKELSEQHTKEEATPCHSRRTTRVARAEGKMLKISALSRGTVVRCLLSRPISLSTCWTSVKRRRFA